MTAGSVLTSRNFTGEALFRDLYTRLGLGGITRRKIVGVTSAIDGEGKTTIASYLAMTVARDLEGGTPGAASGPVLLLDCREGASSASVDLGVPEAPGLIQCLQGEYTLDEAVHQTDARDLWILPAGGDERRFSVAIRNTDLALLRDELLERFQVVVIDMPSVLATSDTGVLMNMADDVVMVARAGVTPAKLIEEAVAEIGEERLTGVILNDTKRQLPRWLEQRW